MKLADVLDPEVVAGLSGETVLGIDIGSRAAKGVLIHGDQLHVARIATGVRMQDSADELLDELLEAAGVYRAAIRFVVGTGYGRIALQFPDIGSRIVTEISCHAMGAHVLNTKTRTIVDIGGQDSKAIQVDPATGRVVRFIMNDKCAAGTGRFLEKAAQLLDFSLAEMGSESLTAQSTPAISSQCTVFAESEIISLRARGIPRADIAAGLHHASARRVRTLVSKIPLDLDLLFTGGVSNNPGIWKALEDLIGAPITRVKLDTIYAGALGAAVYARQFLESREELSPVATSAAADELALLRSETALGEQAFIEDKTRKKVGYLCNYTPVELLRTSGVAFTRILKCGSPDVVSQGELITKSVFCDLTKSVLGHFETKDPLLSGLDQVYTFYTCDSMRATSQAIDNFYKPSRGYIVPRNSDNPESRSFFRAEMLQFSKDLERLTGAAMSANFLRRNIHLYNQVRQAIRDISALRKRDVPPSRGKDFLDVGKAFHFLPPETLLPLLRDAHARLAERPQTGKKPLRLMMCGGIVADGDRRILDILEDEIGARVVVEDHCTGYRAFCHDTDEGIDPWQAMANAYLDQAPCARQVPLNRRIEHATKLAQEYAVDAVLFTYLKFCPCYGLAKNKFITSFQALGLPVLELASDYSLGDLGQIKTRLDAFVEVLSEKKGTLPCSHPAQASSPTQALPP
jgi:predicted CoA-substrate-specific enzyme activase